MNTMNLRLTFGNLGAFFLICFLVFSPLSSSAQLEGGAAQDPDPTTGMINNPLPEVTDLKDFLKTILKAVIKLGIPLVALAIIYSGFLFVTALGNAEKLSKAKDAFIWSLIGAAVLLGSWAIAELIVDTVETISKL